MKTAVEWFFEQIMYADVDIKVWREIYDQAKQMEKEQIIDAYWDGGQDVPIHVSTCEKYYNETFKSDQ